MTDPCHKVPQGKLQGKPPKDSSKPKDLRDDRACSMHSQTLAQMRSKVSSASIFFLARRRNQNRNNASKHKATPQAEAMRPGSSHQSHQGGDWAMSVARKRARTSGTCASLPLTSKFKASHKRFKDFAGDDPRLTSPINDLNLRK